MSLLGLLLGLLLSLLPSPQRRELRLEVGRPPLKRVQPALPLDPLRLDLPVEPRVRRQDPLAIRDFRELLAPARGRGSSRYGAGRAARQSSP